MRPGYDYRSVVVCRLSFAIFVLLSSTNNGIRNTTHPAMNAKKLVLPPVDGIKTPPYRRGTCTPLDLRFPQMGTEELRQRIRLLDNEIRIMRSDTDRIRHESSTQVKTAALTVGFEISFGHVYPSASIVGFEC